MDAEIEALAKAQRDGPRANAPLPAEFEVRAIYDEEEFKKTGRHVYRDQERIIIRLGQRDTVEREVTPEDKRIYAAQYLAWKKGEDVGATEGYPLAQWAAIPGKAVVKQFAMSGIRSIEQLAQVTDSTLQAIGPYSSLRQQARDWVADAQKQAPLTK